MPTFGELPLLVRWIGRGEDKRGAVAQVRIGAVEPVRPQRAIGTALAHVVDDEQIGLVAEQLGEPHAPPARAPERVILHGFGLDRRLHVAHLLAQLADLAAIVSEFFCGVFVAHGFTPHTKVVWREPVHCLMARLVPGWALDEVENSARSPSRSWRGAARSCAPG